MADEPQVIDPHAPHVGKQTAEQPIFCANCQAVTTHRMSVCHDRNGQHELLATCDCGRALKFPEPMIDDRAAFDAHLAAHHAANAGAVSAEQEQAKLAEYDARFLKLMGTK